MSGKTRVYLRDSHSFFDDLVTLLCSLSSVLISVEAFNNHGRTKAVKDPKYYLQFEGATLHKKFTWYPFETTKLIASDGWPTRIELYEDLFHPRSPVFAIGSTGFKGFHRLSIQSSFVRYFETQKPQIELQFGTNVHDWPQPWNFSRVVRNAFAHGGVIYFRSSTAPSVSWKTITYSPADNGRQIVFQDITAVEIIMLMEEMDAVLDGDIPKVV